MEEKSTLKTILTLGGIFVGGYLLYKFFFVPRPVRRGPIQDHANTGTGDGTGTGTGTGDGTGTGTGTTTSNVKTLVPGGSNAVLTDGILSTKSATDKGWNARAYSKEGTTGAISVTASPASSAGTMGVGLATDPVNRNVWSWTNFDYMFYFFDDSAPKRVEIWENGVKQILVQDSRQDATIYKPTDKFTVKYDPTTKKVSYLINGVEKRSVVRTSTEPLFAEATIFSGTGFKDINIAETASFASADGGIKGMNFFARPGF